MKKIFEIGISVTFFVGTLMYQNNLGAMHVGDERKGADASGGPALATSSGDVVLAEHADIEKAARHQYLITQRLAQLHSQEVDRTAKAKSDAEFAKKAPKKTSRFCARVSGWFKGVTGCCDRNCHASCARGLGCATQAVSCCCGVVSDACNDCCDLLCEHGPKIHGHGNRLWNYGGAWSTWTEGLFVKGWGILSKVVSLRGVIILIIFVGMLKAHGVPVEICNEYFSSIIASTGATVGQAINIIWNGIRQGMSGDPSSKALALQTLKSTYELCMGQCPMTLAAINTSIEVQHAAFVGCHAVCK